MPGSRFVGIHAQRPPPPHHRGSSAARPPAASLCSAIFPSCSPWGADRLAVLPPYPPSEGGVPPRPPQTEPRRPAHLHAQGVPPRPRASRLQQRSSFAAATPSPLRLLGDAKRTPSGCMRTVDGVAAAKAEGLQARRTRPKMRMQMRRAPGFGLRGSGGYSPLRGGIWGEDGAADPPPMESRRGRSRNRVKRRGAARRTNHDGEGEVGAGHGCPQTCFRARCPVPLSATATDNRRHQRPAWMPAVRRPGRRRGAAGRAKRGRAARGGGPADEPLCSPHQKAAPGRESPHEKAAPGRESPHQKAAPGRESPHQKAAPGRESPHRKAAPGRESPHQKAAPGRESPHRKAAPGRESPHRKAAPGRESTHRKAAPGRESTQTTKQKNNRLQQ